MWMERLAAFLVSRGFFSRLFGQGDQSRNAEHRLRFASEQTLLDELDAFQMQKQQDETFLTEQSTIESIDLNSHVDLFYAIYKQVRGTPNELVLLNLLQHLVQIELENPLSDCIWQTAEKLVCRSTLINDKDDADKLLNMHRHCSSSAVMAMPDKTAAQPELVCTCPCHSKGCRSVCGPGTTTLPRARMSATESSISVPITTAPLALPPMASDCSTVKIPDELKASPFLKNSDVVPHSEAAAESAPSSPGTKSRCSSQTREPVPTAPVPPSHCVPPPILPPPLFTEPVAFTRSLPQPRIKVKTFAWYKVPSRKINSSTNNVWQKAAGRFRSLSPDFQTLESLFAQPANSAPPEDRRRSFDPSNSNSSWLLQRKLRESCQNVNLLDPKRSLNISIFLKQCRGTIEEFAVLIRNCCEEEIGLERLRCLMKILPEPEEIATLKAYTGDIERLGSPEKFFLTLMTIPSFQLRVEGMLLKAEFPPTMEYMSLAAETIIAASNEILSSRTLPGLLYLVLLVGNFLNSGGYNGNAAGFRLTSLWKLVEVRANKPNVTLMNYVVMEAEMKYPHLLNFIEDSKHLDNATRFSVDLITSDYRSLRDKAQRISAALVVCDCVEIETYLHRFLSKAKAELKAFEEQLETVEKMRVELAEFFCEDVETFKLEECFKIFTNFKARVEKSMQENKALKDSVSVVSTPVRTGDKPPAAVSLPKVNNFRDSLGTAEKGGRVRVDGWDLTSKRTSKVRHSASVANLADSIGGDRERPAVVLNKSDSAASGTEVSPSMQRLLRSNKHSSKKPQRISASTAKATTGETLDEFLDKLHFGEKKVGSKERQEAVQNSDTLLKADVKWTNRGQSIRDSGFVDADIRVTETDAEPEQESISSAADSWLKIDKSIRDSGIDADMDITVNSRHHSTESDMSDKLLSAQPNRCRRKSSYSLAIERIDSTDENVSASSEPPESCSERSVCSMTGGHSPYHNSSEENSTASERVSRKARARTESRRMNSENGLSRAGALHKLRNNSKIESASELLRRVTSTHSRQSYSPARKEKQLNIRKAASTRVLNCSFDGSNKPEPKQTIHVSRARVPLTNVGRTLSATSATPNALSKLSVNRIAIRTALRSSEPSLEMAVKERPFSSTPNPVRKTSDEKAKSSKSNAESNERLRQTISPKQATTSATVTAVKGRRSLTPTVVLNRTYSVKKERPVHSGSNGCLKSTGRLPPRKTSCPARATSTPRWR